MEFILFPIIAMMSLLILTILAAVALVAAIKRRPGIALFAGGLLLLAFLIPAGLMVSYVRVGEVGHSVRIGHPIDGDMHVSWHEHRPAAVAKFSFFGILTFGGLALALICALTRRPSNPAGSCAAHSRRWWPALLIMAPLLFLFVGTMRVRESRRHEMAPPVPHHHQQLRMEASVRQQEREIARQMAEIQRRIERMDIHELMDRVDAPRIVISGPQPGTIPWLALAPLAASVRRESAKSPRKPFRCLLRRPKIRWPRMTERCKPKPRPG